MVGPHPLLLNGASVPGEAGEIAVINPYSGAPVGVVSLASVEQAGQAVRGALAAFRRYKSVPVWQRSLWLAKASDLIAERSEEFARIIAQEVAKPLRTARGEVSRAVTTFRIAAEEVYHLDGEVIPMDAAPGSEGRVGYYFRQPVGPVLAITPFNFPLNLVAHKVAPALAAGNPFILRPTSAAPFTAYLLGEVLLAAGFPPEVVSILPSSTAVAEYLVMHEDIPVVSFTGSVGVGKRIRAIAGLKRVTLELGSNSPNIVAPSADLDAAAAAIVRGGFSHAGQSCVSAQRVYLHRRIESAFLERFLPAVKALKVGDPLEEETDVGPLIDVKAAERIEDWLNEARQHGAKVLTGGSREGAFLWPTVLSDVRPEMKVVCEEVFAPLLSLIPYDDFDALIAEVNESKYGLNAAIFTNDIGEAFKAIRELQVGAVIVNDSSAYRADHMPYGGVKESGLGREGVRYAMEEMTEIKFAAFNLRG